MKKFELKAFLEELSKDEFISKCSIPMGYRASYPIFKKVKDDVVLIIPFNSIRHSKTEGISAVLPISHTVTVTLHALMDIPEQIKRLSGKEEGYSGFTPVGFETLKYNEKYDKVEWSKPVGAFPHKALREIGEEAYKAKNAELFAAYDKVINDLLGIEECSGMDRMELSDNLKLILDPVTQMLYKLIDSDFADKYLIFGRR